MRVYGTKSTEFSECLYSIIFVPKMLILLSDSWLGAFHYNLIKSIKTGNSPINRCIPQVSLVSYSKDLRFIAETLKLYEKMRTQTE